MSGTYRDQHTLACCIRPHVSKTNLCHSDANRYHVQVTAPSNKSGELMKSLTSPSWHFVAVNRKPKSSRLAWDGEVPFIL
jgi:hypothetical protein